MPQRSAPANVHVMAGNRCDGAATDPFVANLSYACDAAAVHGIGILIEPINHHDMPDYFLSARPGRPSI